MTKQDFLKSLNIVNSEDVSLKIEENKDSLLLRNKNTIYAGVIPEKPFPISHPKFILLKDSDGSDICTIEDANKLDEESRKNLEKLLSKLYFIPKIIEILRLEASGDQFEWNTLTDRGERSFNTQGRTSIIFFGSKVVIQDTDENLYEIEDIESLDRRSKEIIESTF